MSLSRAKCRETLKVATTPACRADGQTMGSQSSLTVTYMHKSAIKIRRGPRNTRQAATTLPPSLAAPASLCLLLLVLALPRAHTALSHDERQAAFIGYVEGGDPVDPIACVNSDRRCATW